MFPIGKIENQAKGLSNKHSKGLHVRVKKFAVKASLIHVLTSHKFVGLIKDIVPKVEIVPAIRKIVTAVIFAPRYPSME